MKELITKEGYDLLQEELNYYLKVRRPLLAENLKYATELGDLRENAEYDAALMEYDEVETKIYKLERSLNNSIIVKNDSNNLGSIFKIEYEDKEVEAITLVGPSEVSPLENKISYVSPIGEKLISSKVGDELSYFINEYECHFKVLDISKN